MKLKIGDKIVEADMIDGVPVIKGISKEIRHPDGRVDVEVHVPCIHLDGQTN